MLGQILDCVWRLSTGLMGKKPRGHSFKGGVDTDIKWNSLLFVKYVFSEYAVIKELLLK